MSEGVNARILVIDDEDGMRRSLEMLLSHAGYRVATAENCRAGIGRLRLEHFDAVLTDIVTPEGLGYEVMEHVNRHCPRTRVIAMTAYASQDTAVEALRHGAHDYVTKPFDFDLLDHAITRALNHLRLEEEIRQSRESHRALIEKLNDGYFVLENGCVVYANNTFARLLHGEPDQLHGRPFFDLVAAVSRPRIAEHLRFLEGDELSSVLEDVVLCALDGHHVTVEIKVSTSGSREGRPSVVGICRNVSENKALWGQLIKTEKLALLGEMMAGVAHELNNKLTPILGYSEILTKANLDEDSRRHLNVVLGSALGAKSIVESLLLFARQGKPQKTREDIDQVLTATADLVSCSFGAANVGLKLDLSQDLPPINVDRHQIEQVFVNILKNAYEALPEGGTITVQSQKNGNDILVNITDSGPGIPPHIKAHIFDPFFTTKGRSNGTGLGLSICHGIIRQHQGDIAVYSQGKGTTFCIRLPVDMETSPREQVVMETGPARELSGRQSILVVDDELPIAQLLDELLSEHFETCTVANGDEALRKLSEKAYDLIISDVKMPGLDGIALYQHLAGLSPAYHHRIIYTTGVTFDRRTEEFLTRTKVPLLHKPFKVQEMLNLVYQTLARKPEALPNPEKDLFLN